MIKIILEKVNNNDVFICELNLYLQKYINDYLEIQNINDNSDVDF